MYTLITGASTGIGRELARVFAAHGHDLILVARDATKLERLAQELTTKATVIPLDLAPPQAACQLYAEVRRQGLDVEILVNNAGYGLFGKFQDLSMEDQTAMIQLNVVTLTHLTGLLLPEMRRRQSGRILNVASTAAFQPGPLMAVYYATKAYVLSFSEAIANELEGTGITVTALCPGPTESEFQERSGMKESKLVKGKKIMSAAEVAQTGYKGLMAGKTVVIPGVQNWLLAQSVRLAPRKLATRIVRGIQETRH